MGLNCVTDSSGTVAMSYAQIFCHIVFPRKHREPVLLPDGQPELLEYIWGTIKNQSCHLCRPNADEAGILYDPKALD